ncbi:hypothetical protein GF327_05735 [Candidatus Woesearchaeota archaeon]|nr:hypothetical protein [Candidatus Woesearchaeota archaeon]
MDKKARLAIVSAIFIVSLLIVGFTIAKPNPRAEKHCRDGIDNDGDGYTDWPDDPGCTDKNDRTETDPDIECDDATDNDGDTLIDTEDSGCTGPTDDDESDCADSVCEGTETSETCPEDCGYPDSCSDSDGGIVLTTFGTTSGYYDDNAYSSDDYCTSSENIMEYYCLGDYEQGSIYSCGNDTYGPNYCMNGTFVYRDFYNSYCSSGECGTEIIPELITACGYPEVCEGGECVLPDSCSNTDGGFVPEEFGTVSGYIDEQEYSRQDICISNTTLVEFSCIGDYAYNSTVNCEQNLTTYCSDGRCI